MDLMLLRRRIIVASGGLKKYLVTAASGIVSFLTNVAMPTKVTCEFEPVQYLHGQSAPYPAGSSVNLIPDGTDTSNGYANGKYLKADGTIGDISDGYISEYFEVTAGATYTWSVQNVNNYNATSICFYDSSKNYISGIAGEKLFPKTITIPSGAVYCRATQKIPFSTKGCQIEEGSTATTPLMPYSNVCPISGYTGCEIKKAKKNLFDKSEHTLTKQYKINKNTGETGGFTNTQRGYVDYVEIMPNTTYTLSDVGTETDSTYGIAFYDSAKVYISGAAKTSGNKYTFTTPSNAKYFRATLFNSKTLDTLQLEIGSSATEYEAYQESTKTIDWQSQAGTVYGGTVTLNEDGSADLVVSWAYQDMGSVDWKLGSAGHFYTTNAAIPYKKSGTTVGNIICSCFKNDGGRNTAPWYGDDGTFRYYAGSASTREIYVNDQRYSAVADFKTGVTGEQIAYEINSPNTYHFSNIGALNSFVGSNSIWHDMNGSITVEYYKNT